jgi:hypothetical protein
MTTWVKQSYDRETSAKVGSRTISIALVDDCDLNTSIAYCAFEVWAWIDRLPCSALGVLEQIDDGRYAAIRASNDEDAVGI